VALHVLTPQLTPVVPGCVGELCISGESVGAGYVNRESLNAKFFIHYQGLRTYRTGDLVRYNRKGELVYVGRSDFQVKLRGVRVELEEISNAINQITGVTDSQVLVHKEQLLGFAIARPLAINFQTVLADCLPPSMIPSTLTLLDEWPLTNNGKIDRAKLICLAQDDATDSPVAPRNETEILVQAIWCEVLRREKMGVHADFFALGGHSLLAIRVVTRIRSSLRVDLSLAELFSAATIANLAQLVIERQQAAEHFASTMAQSSIPIIRRDQAIPLSRAQQRLWLIHQIQPDSPMYNMPFAVKVSGKLNIAVLERAFNEIVRRHEILRTTLHVDDEEPYQRIHSAGGWQMETTDEEGQDQAGIIQRTVTYLRTPFNLDQSPLFRVRLVRLLNTKPKQYLLLMNMHHIISDGVSIDILMTEFIALYGAFSQQQTSPLAELTLQYADFAAWQRERDEKDVIQQQIEYWRQQLDNAPLLELPLDFPRSPQLSAVGRSQLFELDVELTQNIRAVAAQHSATLFMTLLAAFQLLLSRYSGQDDISVGAPIANRGQKELEPLVGLFINTLVLRSQIDSQQSFSQLLQQVKETALAGYQHQDVSFEYLIDALDVPRDQSHTPLFQVMFTLQNSEVGNNIDQKLAKTIDLGEIQLSSVIGHSVDFETTTKFDLTLSVTDTGDRLRCSLQYRSELFEFDTIQRMVRHFTVLLGSICSDTQLPVGQLPLMAAVEKQQLLTDWNQTVSEYPRHLQIHQLIEQQARRTPDAIACTFENTSLSYQQLNAEANQLARHLKANTTDVDKFVGVCLERSNAMLVALLAVLKSGCAYVPIDPGYPQSRTQFVIESAQLRLLLTQQNLLEKLPHQNITCICLDAESDIITKLENSNLATLSAENALAYSIYTSGSTGKPKGVAVTQQAFVNFLCAMQESVGINQDNVLLAVTSLSFDIAGLELFLPLMVGARTVIASRTAATNAEALDRLIVQHNVNVLQATPATWQLLIQNGWQPGKGLKALCGGEPLSPQLGNQLLACGVDLYNMYGPTETTVWSTVNHITDAIKSNNVAIGRPIANTSIFILDDAMQPVPIGVAGELYIGGDGLAQGYIGREDLTAAAFISNPFGHYDPNYDPNGSARLYRTGDLARYLTDGQLQCLGRIDQQVKVRGFRIELGEIETLLNQKKVIREGIVDTVNDLDGELILVAYLVIDEALTADAKAALPAEIVEFLQRHLPDYMIPRRFSMLDTLPLTPNGKLDRKALPKLESSGVLETAYVAPRDETERNLIAIWAEVLGQEKIGINDDFFALGGHSLLAVRTTAQIRGALHIDLPLADLFNASTVAKLAAVIVEKQSLGEVATLPKITPADRQNVLPLSLVQHQLWVLEKLKSGPSSYLIPIALKIKGPLQPQLLDQALSQIIARHEILRSCFVLKDNVPQVEIHAAQPWQIERTDITELNDERQQLTIKDHIAAIAHAEFDLALGPLLRTHLIQCHAQPAEQWVLLITMHHIIADGWSMDVFAKEIAICYQALKSGLPAQLPDLAVQYVDYAVWQRQQLQGEVLERELNYWREQLDNEYSVLDLATDFPRPAVQTSNGASTQLLIAKPAIDALQNLAHAEGATLYMALLSIFNLLLQRYTGQAGINIGTSIAGRSQQEMEPLIGLFVNTVVVSTEPLTSSSFLELLTQVREKTLGAFAHQSVPFEKIVEAIKPIRDTSRSLLYQACFNLLNLPQTAQAVADISVELMAQDQADTKAKIELNLYAKETTQGLVLHLVYNQDLYLRQRMQRMLSHFSALIKQVIQQPRQSLELFSLEPSSESANSASAEIALPQPQSQPRSYSQRHPIQQFQQQVTLNPNSLCAADSDQQLSYCEVDQYSDALAHYLKQHDIAAGDVVVIQTQPNVYTVLALLAVLKRGAIFCLLDSAYPDARRRQLLELVKPKFILQTDADLLTLAESTSKTEPLPVAVYQQHQPAYIVFTSGTAGTPKAVVNSVEPLVHFSHWYQQQCQITPMDRFSVLSGLGHDPVLRDILVPLMLGASLCIPSPSVKYDARALRNWFNHQAISICHLTPSMAQLLTAGTNLGTSSDARLESLRWAAFGGDQLPYSAVTSLIKQAPNVRCLNFYGATETPQVAGYYEIEGGKLDGSKLDGQKRQPSCHHCPVGVGIDGVQLQVVNRAGKIVAPGEVGEICVVSPYLSLGYFDELNFDGFNFDEFNRDDPDLETFSPPANSYRTGDHGRYLEDGNVQCLGRMDQQLKIRGFRIDPAEIVQALLQHEAVDQALILDTFDHQGERMLLGFVVLTSASYLTSHPAITDSLKTMLTAQFPAYMVPPQILNIEQTPLTPNGKVDKAHLLRLVKKRRTLSKTPSKTLPNQHITSLPLTPMQHEILDLWQKTLNRFDISIDDNFFEIGGNSIAAVQILEQLRNKVRDGLVITDLYERLTIRQLAAAFSQDSVAGGEQPAAQSIAGTVELSIKQQGRRELTTDDKNNRLARRNKRRTAQKKEMTDETW